MLDCALQFLGNEGDIVREKIWPEHVKQSNQNQAKTC